MRFRAIAAAFLLTAVGFAGSARADVKNAWVGINGAT